MSNPVRTLRTAPGFGALVILTLAIGLGSNVALFTLVNGVLLRPLDFHAPDELFAIHSLDQRTHVANESVSLIDFEDWRRDVPSATGMTALCGWLFNLTGEGEPERLQGARTSGSFFDVFGVPPALGRYFTEQEDHAGRGDLVVISHGLWQRRFGGRPDVLGKRINLNGVASTIIGVTPLRFRYPDEQVELWAPIANEMKGLPRASRFFFAVVRVPKTKIQQARSELETVAGPGQFHFPHSIDIDPNRRVYVADRSNSRIQIFDENGKYLDEWDHIRSPYHIMITQDQHLWVSDGVTSQMVEYDLNGKYLYSWGSWGAFPGGMWGVHQFSVDSEGNLYTSEVFGGRQQKFRPKKGVDQALLVGQPLRTIRAR